MTDKKYWSERIRAQTPYTAGEQPKIANLIKLNTNENPYPWREGGEAEWRLYPDPNCSELTEAIAELCGVQATQVFVGNGSDEVLAFAFAAFFDGGTLYAPDVSYSFYPVWASFFNCDYRTVPLNADFTLPIEQFYTLRGGGAVIANPNAPTGLAAELRDIERIVASNPEHVVIIDEAYIDFARAESAASLIKRYPNLLVTRTMSKSYSLAGLRVGWAMGSENLIAALNAVKECLNSYTVDANAQRVATLALRDREWFERRRRMVTETRDRFQAELRRLGFTVTDSQTNFVFASHPERLASELQQQLRERGILVRRFDLPRISNYLRISVGTPDEMNAVIKVLEELL